MGRFHWLPIEVKIKQVMTSTLFGFFIINNIRISILMDCRIFIFHLQHGSKEMNILIEGLEDFERYLFGIKSV